MGYLASIQNLEIFLIYDNISNSRFRFFDGLKGKSFMSLTKNHIIESISRICSTRKDAEKILYTLLENIKSTLAAGEDVLISGFGKFCVKDKKQRRGRNPSTGSNLILDARKVVTFSCSTTLRDKINKNLQN